MDRENMRGSLGNWLAPPRFLAFLLALLLLYPLMLHFLPWLRAFLAAFDLAALLFILTTVPLFRESGAREMRLTTSRNDANRLLLLTINSILSLTVLSAIALELGGGAALTPPDIALIIASLAIAWAFGNLVYALHYAHIFYLQSPEGKDMAGVNFPGTEEPDYWDFLYFAFTLGMTFQTSDVSIENPTIRRVATFHCAAAFVFNIGVLAFSINVLGN